MGHQIYLGGLCLNILLVVNLTFLGVPLVVSHKKENMKH